MLVGFTYDLRDDYLAAGLNEEETAEFDRLDTIEGIEGALAALGFETERVGNARALVSRLAAGARWDIVFNIAEGLRGLGREALVPALLEAYGIPCVFSDPLVLSLTLHKGMTKRVVRDLGIPTADFAVVAREEDLAAVSLPYPLFAKPVAEGTGKGVTAASRIETPAALRAVTCDLLSRFSQPVLIERYLPGREFTVGVAGTGVDARVLGVMEVDLREGAEGGGYSYHNKKHYEDVVAYRLADDPEARRAAEVSLAAWRGLGCADGGRVDVRSDERGTPNFVEVNALAGLNPTHSDLPILCRLNGISFTALIAAVMASALARHGLPEPGALRAHPRP